MSMWLGPPARQTMMTERAAASGRLLAAAAVAGRPGSVRPGRERRAEKVAAADAVAETALRSPEREHRSCLGWLNRQEAPWRGAQSG